MARTKALLLLSGGLDSAVAAKVVLQQGGRLEGVNFASPFSQRGKGSGDPAKLAEELGIKLRVVPLFEECLEIVKNPKHGYGSNLNPCIDCRILMLKKAKACMEEAGASFLVTGEVLGQRPMSQRGEAFKLIDKEAGVEGLVLRPLSAKFLPPTKAEEEGWIDREALLSIKGKSRKKQLELARTYRISGYSCPSGGCLLTDPGFSKRLGDLLKHRPDPTLDDIELLKVGRHFRLSAGAKLVVGRNKEENEKIRMLCGDGDLLFEVPGFGCPVSIARGSVGEAEILASARIEARYSDAPKEGFVEVACRATDGKVVTLNVKPASDEEISALRIG
ncbi:MAG: hypothetical protein QXF24_07720 [Thermoproteota archaeon]